MRVAFLFYDSCDRVVKSVGGLVVHTFQNLAPCFDSVVLCAGKGSGYRDGIPYIGIGDIKSPKLNKFLRRFFVKYMRFLYLRGILPQAFLKKRVEALASELGVDVIVPIYSDIPEIKYFAFGGTLPLAIELLIDSVSYEFIKMGVLEKLVILTLLRMSMLADKDMVLFALSKRDLDMWFKGPLSSRGTPVYLGLPKDFKEKVTSKIGKGERQGKVKFYHVSVFMTKRDYHHIILASKMLKDKGYDFDVNLRITTTEPRVKQALLDLVCSLKVEDVVNLEISDTPLPIDKYIEFHLNNDVLLWTGRLQGYGITPLEALYLGNPAIVTEKAGIAEVLRGTKGVKIYNPERVEDLAKAMEWYLVNDDWKEIRGRYRDFVDKIDAITCKMLSSVLSTVAGGNK